ncbi:uncharacterized protein LOC133802047 [Humulus lupulus]|uniref:uncharacterized protein LOC133802047 n=1 Tax=Humulus lupulus TaxID=3486 RepID=UPI002B4159C5|nr:uncharacterized protein LOC133802047 [Humulus lupulus]
MVEQSRKLWKPNEASGVQSEQIPTTATEDNQDVKEVKGKKVVIASPPKVKTRNSFYVLEDVSVNEVQVGEVLLKEETNCGKILCNYQKYSVADCDLEDIKFNGNFFTWNNKQEGKDRVYAKWDRFLANHKWMDKYTTAEDTFFPEGDFDHSPGLLSIYPNMKNSKKPSRYFNFWKNLEGFVDTVNKNWKVKTADSTKLAAKPWNAELIEAEIRPRHFYVESHGNYISYLSQKAKVAWIKSGDDNTKVFHASLKRRRQQNTIYSIKDQTGRWIDDQEGVIKAFLDFYNILLGSCVTNRTRVHKRIFQEGPMVTQRQADWLWQDYTKEEVKDALHSIPDDKALGPNGRLLKEINATIVTLIPKLVCPESMSDYSPIACCNVIYKIASKIICKRLQEFLTGIISENQSDFVKGRQIAHNIMICQDMVWGYDRSRAKSTCLFKIDLQKAYDMLDWEFLREMLEALNFPQKFVNLIMECVTTPLFSFSMNGALHGYLQAERGLRQGDPITPLLFVIGMECLSRIMLKVAKEAEFKFHPRCKSLKLTHLCFAYDLLLFSKGDYKSATLLLRGFKLFSNSSGLKANVRKSIVYGAEEGLGFKDIALWNLCTMGKHVWAISSKKDNLWVKWVNSVYIKQREWWDYEPSLDATCCILLADGILI